MKRNLIILLCGLLFFYSTVVPSEKIEKNPVRIISLGPYVTENLLLLGIEKEIIGVTVHEKPEIKKDREIIGTLLEPNIEAIVKLRPDIVIASKEGNRKHTVEKLKSLGIPVEVLDEVVTYSDLKKNFLKLAEITGKTVVAKKIISNVDEQLLKYIKKKHTNKKIFWQLGTKPLVTAGGKTYFSEISIYAGAKNIFNDMKTKYITISTEEVIKRNPDVIIAMGMGEESYVLNFWKPFKNIEAVKKNKIFRVDDYMFCSPTPLSFLQSIELITKLIEN